MIRIAGTGRTRPAKCVTSDMLDKRLGRKVPLFSATGLKVRYVCEDETQVDLAVIACQAAIKDAGLVSADIDMVISGSAVPYQTLPATDRLIMCRLGIADGQAS
ncbi:MAG: ketoacyl-ACP synthase III, partial [Yoonia sp.]|nr:ketoacyl-ACP synthase III [Yoonia sp.]